MTRQNGFKGKLMPLLLVILINALLITLSFLYLSGDGRLDGRNTVVGIGKSEITEAGR